MSSSNSNDDHKEEYPEEVQDQVVSSNGKEGEVQQELSGPVFTRAQKISGIFTIICCGFALISDGLQNNLMSLTNVVFAQIYLTEYTSLVSTRLSNALTIGTIFGQIGIGLICDLKGRKWGIVLSTVLIVLGVILCTAAHGADGSVSGFFWMFTICRGITGVGVGGEYSASSSSAIEATNERAPKNRPIFVMVTNFVLSFGGPCASILYLIVFQIVGGGTLNINLETLWRTTFAISVVPPLAVFIFRMRMLNSTLYQKSAIKKSVPYALTFKYYWKSLIGTAGAWFLYDVVVFPNGVFSSTIIASIVKEKGPALIKKTAEYNLLLGTLALPGVIIGALLINRLGRRNTMMLGFAGYLIFGLSVGLAYDTVILNVPLFVVLYGLMQSSGNLGPGDCLGLISSESYATPVRGTLYGLSAAIGKAGAVVGVQTFTPIRTNLGPRYTFIVAAAIGVLGVLVTFFFVRNDLDGDLSLEDAKFSAYLAANGWKGEVGSHEYAGSLDSNNEKGEKEAVEATVVPVL